MSREEKHESVKIPTEIKTWSQNFDNIGVLCNGENLSTESGDGISQIEAVKFKQEDILLFLHNSSDYLSTVSASSL